MSTDRSPDAPGGDEPPPGQGIVNLDFAGTGALVVAAITGAAAPDTFGSFTVAVSAVLFGVGTVALLWAYAQGVVRSREERITVPGLFFLSGTAPKVVRFRLRAALAVQVVAAVAAASIRPYTSVAFAVLAPMAGLGLMAAWGARHGTFFAKDER